VKRFYWLILASSIALAQSVPNGTITQGQVWTAAQWNSAWAAKVDVIGGTLTSPTLVTPQLGAATATTINGVTIPSVSDTAVTLNASQTLTNKTIANTEITGLGTFSTQNYATPPAIGGTTPAAGAFTTLSATGLTTLATGTATVTPLEFTSGALNTTPVAGAIEFNGNNLYFSSVASQRATALTAYEYVTSAATTLGTSGSWLSASGTPLTAGVTLQGSTIYEFEGEFLLTSSGTTSHTEAIGFTLTTMTVNNIAYSIERISETLTVTGVEAEWSAQTAVTVMSGAITSAQTAIYRIKGTVSVNAGGSMLPIITFSTAPGGTQTSAIGAYFRIWPLGPAGAAAAIGSWS